tara:strand:- start:236 stop:649 length:414 start_codon:yes stop_codon:yes gene_type:complete
MLGADPLVGDIKSPENKLLDRINDAILSIKTSAELSEENKSDLLSKVQNELLGASDATVAEKPIIGDYTKSQLLDINDITDLGNRTDDEQFFRRIGTDKGLMEYYDKALQSRKNDRILEGINSVGGLLTRMSLINKL